MKWWKLKFGPSALCSTPCVGLKGLTRPFEDEYSGPRVGLAVCRPADC